jgi:hypothetical protein
MKMKKTYEEVRYDYDDHTLMESHFNQMQEDGWIGHVIGDGTIPKQPIKWFVRYRKGEVPYR